MFQHFVAISSEQKFDVPLLPWGLKGVDQRKEKGKDCTDKTCLMNRN